ncbi:MAG: tetratricopeptide repeat protein [Phycisphaerales bacterium]|nr:tetratricopeptide repeat protein [Phycisphaerales bacterium]
MPGETPKTSETRRDSRVVFVGGLLLLCTIVAIVHWPVLSAQALNLDDGDFLRDNPLVQNPSWNSAKRFLVEVLEPSTVDGYYLPVSMISLMGDYAAGGRVGDLHAFHRTALILHILNMVLIAVLLRMLFGHTAAALLTALLFGLHPLTVEPVAWIGERKTLLAMMFALVTMISYVQFTRHRRWYWMVGATLAFLLALLSKPTAVPLPLMLVAMDYWPLQRAIKRSIVEKIPLFGLAVIFAVITLVSHSRTAGLLESSQRGFFENILLTCHLVAFYGQKLIVPSGLTSVYPPPTPISLSNATILIGVLVTVVVLGVLLYSMRRSRVLVGGAAHVVLGLAPTLGFVRYSWIYASDKYLYLPAIGILLVIAWGLKKWWPKGGLGQIGLVVAVLIVCGLESMGVRSYLGKWRDTKTLCEHMDSLAPGTPQILVNLADAYEEDGRRADAIALYRSAVERMPDYALAQNNLGSMLAREGHFDDAVKHLRKALELDAGYAPAYSNLAFALLDSGQVADAESKCQKAIELKPGYPRPMFVMGRIKKAKGDLDGAIEYFRKAVSADRNYAEALMALADTLQLKGRMQEASDVYKTLLTVQPRNAVAHHNYAIAMRESGDHAAAVAELKKAIELDPSYADAHNNLGVSLAALGKPEEAIEQFSKAVQLSPDYGEAYHNSGLVYQQLGRHKDATASFRKAAELSPDDPEAQFVYGVSASLSGEAADALAAFRRMLELDPANPGALNSVAWILASNSDESIRDADEAILLATKAAERTNYRQPQVLDTLATAYAAKGRFDDAVMMIRKALELAEAQGQRGRASVEGMRKRLMLFESKTMYTE